MAVHHREVEWLVGIDARATDRGAWSMGRIRATDWAHPNEFAHGRYHPNAGAVGQTWRPFLTDQCPIPLDAAGLPWPFAQVFAAFPNGLGSVGVIRTVGDATNPLLGVGYPYPIATTGQAKRESWPIYRPTGMPSGSSVTFKFFDTLGTPTLPDFTITAEDFARNPTCYLPAQLIDYDTDPSPYMEITWSGGLPRYETIALSMLCTAHYVPVPTTLNADYTARTSTDTERGGVAVSRAHSDRRRTRSNPRPWEPAVPFGQADLFQAQFWEGGELKTNTLFPSLNGSVGDITATVPAWPNDGRPPYAATDPQSTTISSAGAAYLMLDVDGGATFTVKVWGGPGAGTLLYSAAGSVTSGIFISPPALPALGSPDTYRVEVYKPGGGAIHWTDSCQARLRIGPRLDMSLAFVVVGRDSADNPLAAPAGYVASAVSAYTPGSPNVVRLAAGVTNATALSSFKPGADGWYQTKNGVTPVAGGEDDFGRDDLKQIDRGHTNHPYYCAGACDLSAYTPSPTAIASGGTSIATTIGNWWGYGKITPLAAVPYEARFVPNLSQLRRGLVVEWSYTDVTVVTPAGRIVFETLDETAGLPSVPGAITWAGTSATPDATPSINEAWVVAAGATGLWAGHVGQWALWDDVSAAWLFFTPNRGSYLVNAAETDWTWFDGTAWKAKTDPVITLALSPTVIADIGIVLRSWSIERTSPSPATVVSWS